MSSSNGHPAEVKWQAVRLYALGHSRREIAERTGVSKRTVERWRRQSEPCDWEEYVTEVAQKCRSEEPQKTADAIAEMNRVHAYWGRKLFVKSAEEAEALSHKDAYAAQRAAEGWAKMERVAQGQPSDVTATEVEHSGSVEHSYPPEQTAEVLKLAAELGLLGGDAPEGDPEVHPKAE